MNKSSNLKFNPGTLISSNQWQQSAFRSPAVLAFIQHLVADIDKGNAPVPHIPSLGLKILEQCASQHADAGAIAELIEMDFVYSRRIVDFANWQSTERKKITSVMSAVLKIGFKRVRNIVIARHIDEFSQRFDNPGVDERFKVIKHNMLRCAAVAEILSKKSSNRVNEEDAQLAGMLSFIGMLPIMIRYDQHPESLHDLAMLDRVMVYDHARIGSALLKSWGLTKQFTSIPVSCADLTRVSYSGVTLEDVVTIASLHVYLGKNHPLAKIDWKSVPAVQAVGLSPQDTLNVIQQVKETLQKTKWVFSGT